MSNSNEKETQNTDISTLITSLLSNPQALSKMGDILSKISEERDSQDSPLSNNNLNNTDDNTTTNYHNMQNSDNISSTYQNLDIQGIMSKLPDILSKISSTKAEDSIATKQQIALLLAIRPYLSDHRKELIDTFIKMNRLGAIFKNLT